MMSTLLFQRCYDTCMSERKPRFREWLLDQLASRDWRQADLARAIGVDPSQVSRWINGKDVPSAPNAIRLADALGADRDFVLDLTGHRPLPQLPPDLSDPRVLFFAAHAKALTDEEWAVIRSLIEQFTRDE